MKIKEMGVAERPREKMKALGPDALSNGELLAVILRSGSAEENVTDLSRRLLALAGNTLTGLFSLSPERMAGLKGLGPCKVASVLAALELGRRFSSEGSNLDKKPVTTADIAYEMMRPHFKGLKHEECWVMYLNNSNYVLDKRMMTTGAGDQTVIDIKKVVRTALDKEASSLILFHNHPSGNPHPSGADIEYTGRLHDALKPFGISLLDHIVVCDDCYFSFSDDRMRCK
ncbi:MAG: DNA repair protein RadC [Bacteroidales bacterium]|nr:DNA repair protein RadC [Bacteroidales bacterium]